MERRTFISGLVAAPLADKLPRILPAKQTHSLYSLRIDYASSGGENMVKYYIFPPSRNIRLLISLDDLEEVKPAMQSENHEIRKAYR